MKLKDFIKTRRKELTLSLEDVGKFCGVSKSTVLRWESGNISSMRSGSFVKLATVLEADPEFLLMLDTENEIKASQTQQKLINMISSLNDEECQKIIDIINIVVSQH